MAREGLQHYGEIYKCQIVDKYNLTDRKVPSIMIKGGFIRFNTLALHMLDDTPYIKILVNPDEQYLLAVPCGKYDVHAIDWCKRAKKTGKTEPKVMRSKFLSPKLYRLMKWDESYSYRVQCFYQTFEKGKCLLYFDLTQYVTIVPVTIETADGKVRKTSKPYYQADWQESFGPPLKELEDKVHQDFMAYYIANPNEESDDIDMEVFEHASPQNQDE